MDQPVKRVLADKAAGREVECVSPDTTIAEAVRQMNRRRIGALIVVEQGQVVGIFTERDVLVRVVDAGRDPTTTPVAEVMTERVLTIEPDTSVSEAMSLMTESRCRHLPVMDEGQLAGLISIGDLTRWVVRDQQHMIRDLEVYIMRS